MSTVLEQAFPAHIDKQLETWSEALAAEGFDAVLVLAGRPHAVFLDDQHYPFLANPHFLAWVPGPDLAGAALIVRQGQRPQLYLHQPRDYWHAAPKAPAPWWARHFDLSTGEAADGWLDLIPSGRIALIAETPQAACDAELNPAGLLRRLHLARTRKSDYEIACLREAQAIACRGHLAARDAFLAGESELRIHQAYLNASDQLDTELPYHSIVALNENGAVLHYQWRERQPPQASRSFLIDAGGRHLGYCADISRSYAEPGEFAELIKALDAAQQSLCDAMRAGTDYGELHHHAHLLVAGILRDAGVIHVDPESAVESGLSSVFLPHGLGHFLGLQVHDVAAQLDNDGRECPPPAMHPHLRLNRSLEAGNVLTVEPGIYFIDSLLAEAAAGEHKSSINWQAVEALKPYGGIRVEDNVLVTTAAPINLTREAFADLAGGTA